MSALGKRHRANVKNAAPRIIARAYGAGFPDVQWTGVQSILRMPSGRKWATGAGDRPLFRNSLIGMAVMRELDAKNAPHRTIIGCKLYLVWSGEVTLEIERKKYLLKKGDWMVVPAPKLQRVRHIKKGSTLLLFRAPDVGDTKWDKMDVEGRRIPERKK